MPAAPAHSPVALSVLVVTRDAEPSLADLAARVRAQRFAGAVEWVAVDRGSTDGTRALLEAHADQRLYLPRSAGLAECWNRGLELARAERVVLLGQAALPADLLLLRHLAQALEDVQVAAAFGQQLGPAAPGAAARGLRQATPEDFARLDFDARLARCRFDAVCACLRREAWRRQPFRPLGGAEGFAWARAQLLSGQALADVPAAAVYVLPPRRPLDAALEAARLHRQLEKLLGPGARQRGADALGRPGGAPALRASLSRGEEPAAVATTWAAALGARAGARLGRLEARVRKVVQR